MGRVTRPYWFSPDDAEPRSLLEALREMRQADDVMRRRASRSMDMNVSDLQALQLVIAAARTGQDATPRELSRRLGITTASTTKLLDRLCASGHLVRRTNPSDRRSVVVTATPAAHEEVRQRLAGMHERMIEVARQVPPESRPDVRRFLLAMAHVLATAPVDVGPPVPEPEPEAEPERATAGVPGT